MHKISQIRKSTNNKLITSFKRQLQKPLAALSYTGSLFVYINTPTGEVIYLILENGIMEEIWAQSLIVQNMPNFSYTARLKLPQSSFSSDIFTYIPNYQSYLQTDYFEAISKRTPNMLHPWGYHRYQLDGGIISLYFELKDRGFTEFLLAYKCYLDTALDAIYQTLINNLEHYHAFNITNAINFCDTTNNIIYLLDQSITSQFKLNHSELKVLKLIYAGIYKNKDIAWHAHLSNRTIDGIILNLREKLMCQSKEELIAKIHTLHSVIRNSILNQLQLQ
ncbi:helix-turn-helix transcriptional regulator [Fangia hongkongensis]|uniref:helix-turn-helix transcriptional regulator n=2 Tax=Fangia hongkongensis TaxID=270495 RepID=UPI00037587C6|nr:LuxR C-terminal-related transcriptional regulator [Fangia hongkongensis]